MSEVTSLSFMAGLCGFITDKQCGLALTVNLTQPRLVWEESLNEGLSTCLWWMVLIKLSDVGRPTHCGQHYSLSKAT